MSEIKGLPKLRIYVDMDGTLAKWNSVAYEEQLFEKNYFLNLEPDYTIINALKNIYEKYPEIEMSVLSCYLFDSPYALSEKKEWISIHAPFLCNGKEIYVPYGDDKFRYIEEMTKQCVLIDDYSVNLHGWEQHGGTGVKYMNGINGKYGTWKGTKVESREVEKTLLDIVKQYAKANDKNQLKVKTLGNSDKDRSR